MKLYLSLITACLILAACHPANKELRAVIDNADSAAINYYAGDSVIAVSIVKDNKRLGQLTTCVTDEIPTPAVSKVNNFDGSIHFFKNDSVVQVVYFNAANYKYFIYNTVSGISAADLSPDAVTFLMSLKR